MRTKLWPHQIEAVEKLSNSKVLVGQVGSGKSMASLAYFLVKVCGYGRIEGKEWINESGPTSPRDLYIITTARKRDTQDWQLEAARFGLVSDGSVAGIRVIVDSWNNISKYVGTEGAFFIFDEQRLVGSGVWVKSFLELARNNQWILLSATPGDTWSDYVPLFLANGFYANKTAFERRHVVYRRFAKYPQIDRYLETGYLERLRSRILVEMPDLRTTNRHEEYVNVKYPVGELGRITRSRFNPFTDKPMRGAAELCQVARRVVLEDPSRVSALLDILGRHDRVIIFYNYNYELDLLRQHLDAAGVRYSEWNGKRHDAIPDTSRWAYLVQYTAGAEGWNCTTTDTVVFFSLNYSWKIMEQAHGRIDRMNTPYTDLYYYHLVSAAWIDKGVLKALKQKKKFQEGAYGKRMWR